MRFARCAQASRHVAFETLDLLDADDVPWLGACKPARETFALGGPQTVDVEGDDSHRALQIARAGSVQHGDIAPFAILDATVRKAAENE